jgi:hypothetical protein
LKDHTEVELFEFGIGKIEDPFIAVVITKGLLRKVMNTKNVMFHIDTTHNTITLGYNAIIGGVSNMVRSFHPMFVAISPHRNSQFNFIEKKKI